MNDKAMLLSQLRLDRVDEALEKAPRARPWWVVGVVVPVVVVVTGAAGYLMLARSREAAPVRVVAATASAVKPVAGAPRTSTAIDASGYVVPAREATVSAKIVGRLVDVRVEEGQAVVANQVIARVDDSNTRAAVEEAQARVEQARVTLHASEVALGDARRIFGREQLQRAAQVISAQAFDDARAQFNSAQSDYAVKGKMMELARTQLDVAQRNEDDTVMRAPFSGLVTVRTAQVGETVSPLAGGGGFTRTGICTIVDMESLGVEVDVSESSINRVHVGQPATVRLDAYPDWQIPGEVAAIVPLADRSKATVRVRVSLKEKDPRIIPEGSARVAFLNDQVALANTRPRLAGNLRTTVRN